MTDLAAMWSSLRTELDAHRPGRRAEPGSEAEYGPAGRPAGGARTPVPVTLLTGFLGAGKSTLLAGLLREPQGLVVRAVVNDVGTLPFDPTLVEAADGVRIELTNGCGCCERGDDLAATLVAVAAAGPDLIVLEASGVADPLALAQLVEADLAVRLDRIVAVVDAGIVARQLTEPGLGPIVGRQLDAAHAVVLSHVDRLPPPSIERATRAVAGAAPGRVVVPSTLDAPTAEVLTPDGPRGARPSPRSAVADHDLVVMTVAGNRRIERAAVVEAMVAHRPRVVRVKGRLLLGDGPALIQCTGHSISISSADPIAPSGTGVDGYGLTIVATGRAEAEAFAATLGLRPAR